MLSDDIINNKILYRKDNAPLLPPPPSSSSKAAYAGGINESSHFSLQTLQVANSNLMIATTSTDSGKLSTAQQRKSIRLVRPETLKRATNDAWMAAAIGDLGWLKQTLVISSEIAFDKNVSFICSYFKKRSEQK